MVFLFTIIRVALKALGLNKMRSILTMLGIIIGVGAVIAMVSIGQGAQATIAEQIASAGSNMLYVTAGSYNRGGVRSGAGTSSSLTVEDYQGIVRECTAVREASPLVRASAPVVFGDENWFTNIQGVKTNFLRIKLWEMAGHENHRGRWRQLARLGPDADQYELHGLDRPQPMRAGHLHRQFPERLQMPRR